MIPKTAKDVEQATLEDLDDFLFAEDFKLRADAICAIGDRIRTKQIESIPAPMQERIAELLTDNNKQVRLEASIALAEIQDRRATQTLLRFTKPTKSRLDAIYALGRMGDPSAIKPLHAILQKWLYPWADKMQAAAALCLLHDATGSTYLENHVQSRKKAQRVAAIHFIGECHHPKALDLLQPIAQDNNHPHQAVAIRALGYTQDSRARAILEKCFDLPLETQADKEWALKKLQDEL